MSVASVLAPVFVQVALVYALLIWLSVSRNAAMRSARLDPDAVALGKAEWPRRPTQIDDSYGNQFELPVLFFALVSLALITHKAGLWFVVLEWLFVLFRLIQAAIHTTSNVLALRGAAFMASATVLGIEWVVFGAEILAGSP